MQLLTRHRTATERPVDRSPRPPKAPDDEHHPIGAIRWRQQVRVAGRVRSVRIAPWADVPTLECTLVDATGGITLVFLGRRQIAGIHPGALMEIEGVASTQKDRLAVLNPTYTLLTAIP